MSATAIASALPSGLLGTGGLLASESGSFNPLPAMILIPVIGALLIAIIPTSRLETVKQLAVSTSVASGALALYVLSQFDKADAGFQFVVDAQWIESLGIGWHLGVDGISLFMIALTGVLFPLCIVALKPGHDDKQYYVWMLLLMAGSMGVFAALDLVLFFVFFEIVLIPMYFLIGKWGHGERIYAATKFFLFTMFGSAFMLVGIVATAVLHQRATGGVITFDLVEIAETQALSTAAARWLFASFAIAFAVKVPLFPFHTWLPDAHTQAPTAGSVILAGVMLKMGTYGFLRFGLYLFPEASHFFAPAMLTLGVIGILYGAVVATMQRDLKRLVAYSSIAHLGFIILGTFALNTEGVTGGVVQMVNHGISTPALFLLVGMIYERRHTRQISELGGLQHSAPKMAAVFTVVMLASIGLPGLNGFVGEFLALLGAFKDARWWAVAAAAGVILAALYLLWAYQRVFHGPAEGDNATMSDMNLAEGLYMAPLIALIIALGVYPAPMLERIEPSVEALLEHVHIHDDSSTPGAVPVPTDHDSGADNGEDGH